MTAMKSRLAQELKQLQLAPPPGVCAWPVQDKLNELEAQVCGPTGTVYEGGVFRLSVHLPERYPFEPPKVRFVTPVYHPNIDNGGRICLDTLNMPPKGAWKPSLNISTVLASVGLLLGEPNPDDGLMTDVTHEYKHDRDGFDAKARQMTAQHAREAPVNAQEVQQAEQETDAPTQAVEEFPNAQEVASPASSSSSSSGSDDEGKRDSGEMESKKPRLM